MIGTLRTAETKDLPALAEFLARIYQFDPSASRVSTSFLRWKYLDPRPGWKESRSYLLEREGAIVAHCGVCPVTYQTPSGDTIPSLTMMDWAADSSAPGSGIMLFRKLMAMRPTSFVVGGAPATRQILPRIGFHSAGDALTYASWLRPWREFLARPRSGRSAFRLLHGLTHPARSRWRLSHDWDSLPVTEFDDSLLPVLTSTKLPWTRCQRTIADLNYLLHCPRPKMDAFLLRRCGHLAGYFILGRSAWETRLLDILVDSGDENEWNLGLAAATEAALLDTQTCRIRVLATVPTLNRALLWNGYWVQFREPILVYDPTDATDKLNPVCLQLFDGDSGY